jgi:Ca2+-binding RTX toxin-like protein
VAAINGTAGDDILIGTPGDDQIDGGSGNDQLSGGAGDDFLSGDDGNDTLDGGPGFDTAAFSNYGYTSGTVQINLKTGTASGPGSGNDTLISIEHVMAMGNINTTIIGDDNGDALEAMGYASNTVTGGAGNDLIADWGRASVLDGGGGSNGVRLIRDQNADGSYVTTPFTQTFTPGVSGTLADGTTYANFDYYLVQTGNGDDTVTFIHPKINPAVTQPITSASQFLPNNEWNAGGGNDTAIVDLSNYSTPLVMFQTPNGGYSISTTGGGILSFLDVENFQIIGGSGDDTLTTGNGNDILTGGAGNDTLDGGAGSDTARYSGLAANYRVDQLGATTFRVTDLRAGSPDGTDMLYHIEALQWGDGSITRLNDSPPTVLTSDVSASHNQTFAITSLVSVSDADGDTITRYQVYDGNNDPNSGYFTLNGQALPARTVIDLTAAQFAQLSFVSGKVNDQLQVRAFDGTLWSAADNAAWAPFTVSVPANHPPQLSTLNKRIAAGQSVSAGSMISVTDADGDSITRFQLYDGTSDPNSGYFTVNGQVQPSDVVIDLTAAQFALTSFVAGTVNDALQIRASDGMAWSAADNASWAPFTAGPTADNPPTISVFTSANATAGVSFPLPANITVSDADGDTITRWQLYDDNADPNSGHFVVNGQVQAKRTVIDLSPAQFAQASFVAGTHSDTLEVRAFDGTLWSAADTAPWNPFTVQLPADHAPVVTTTNQRVPAGQPLALSSLITVTDADGDTMTRYQLYDGNSDPNSGYFVLNGQALPARVVIDLTAAQAAQVTYVPGTVTDNLQVRVFDGLAWSAADNANWAPFNIGQFMNTPPVVSTATQTATRAQTIALSSMVSVSDAENDTITAYQIYDDVSDPNSGHFIINGQAQTARTVINLTPSQFAQTSFVTGTVNDTLEIRAFDGIAWSAADTAAWSPFTVMVPADRPPVVTTADMKTTAGQTLALSSLITVSDADGDSMTRYQLYDGSNDPNSGYFTVNGQVQSSHVVIDLTAAQAAQTSFVSGTVNDTLQIRAFDGISWSAADNAAWSPFTIGPANHAPVVTTSDKRVAANQAVSLSSLLSISDADNDQITRYQLYDGTSDPNSGFFITGSQAQPARQVIDLTAAQAAITSFVAGTVNDNLQIRVFDGQAWSAADSANWAPFTAGPTVDHAPVVTTGTVSTQTNHTLAASSLFTVSDADNDTITRYQLWDDTADASSGHFVVNGVAQAAHSVIDITASQLSQTSFITGTTGDSLQIRAFDGTNWSAADSAAWSPFLVTVS